MGRKVDTKAAAEHTGLAVSTLCKKRITGGGPPFAKLGSRVLYDTDDLNEWLASHPRISSTAESDDRRGQKANETRRRREGELAEQLAGAA